MIPIEKINWLNQLELGVLLASKNGQVIFSNKKFCNWFGYSSKETQSTQLLELLKGVNFQIDLFFTKSNLKLNGDYSLTKKNGTKIQVRLNFSSLNIEDKIFLLIQVQNISILKKMESLFYKKTALAHLGEMVAGLSHELNNKLAIIIGQTNVLEDKAEDNDCVESKVVIDRCLSITDKSFKISKIINSIKLFHPKYIANEKKKLITFKYLVAEVKNLYLEKLREQNIDLQIIGLENEQKINCLSIKLCQALLIIIRNSILSVKGRSDSYISIKYSCENDKLRICVTDSGEKLDEKDQLSLFLPPYVQDPQSKLMKYDLLTVVKLLEPSQGQLIYNSEKESMSFSILLPS